MLPSSTIIYLDFIYNTTKGLKAKPSVLNSKILT